MALKLRIQFPAVETEQAFNTLHRKVALLDATITKQHLLHEPL
jgi:hypothetical protein